MSDTVLYLKDKQDQIVKWIRQIMELNDLCRDADKDIKNKIEVQLSEFGHNLEELHAMFREFQDLNDHEREKFRSVIEKNWCELEKSFELSLSEYEDLIREKTN